MKKVQNQVQNQERIKALEVFKGFLGLVSEIDRTRKEVRKSVVEHGQSIQALDRFLRSNRTLPSQMGSYSQGNLRFIAVLLQSLDRTKTLDAAIQRVIQEHKTELERVPDKVPPMSKKIPPEKVPNPLQYLGLIDENEDDQ